MLRRKPKEPSAPPSETQPYPPTPAPVPAPAPLPGVADTRPPVLPEERPMFEALRARLVLLRGQIGLLLTQSPPVRPWAVPDNENIVSMLAVLDDLNASLAAERVVVRFDITGNAVAQYAPATDTIHVRKFSGEVGVNETAVNMVHEYTHYRQDADFEQELREGRTPEDPLKEEVLGEEMEGYRNHVYFRSLIEARGYRCDVADIFGTAIFLDRFERERTAATPKEKADARATILEKLDEGGYGEKIEARTPSRVYMVELRPDRRAVIIGEAGAEIDLGPVPPAYNDRIQVSGYLMQQVNALPTRGDLFQGQGGEQFRILEFVVFEAGQEVAGFDLQP